MRKLRKKPRSRNRLRKRPFMFDAEDFEFMDDIDRLYADWVEWTGVESGK